MDPEIIITIAKEAVKTTILVSMPMLGLGLIIGLIISIFQAITQIHEMTLTFVPKILVVLIGLIIFSGWITGQLIQFTKMCLDQIPILIK